MASHDKYRGIDRGKRAFGNSLDNRYSSCQCRLFACIWSFLIRWWCQIAQHALNRRPINPSGAILGEMLNILAQTSAAVDPGNRALNHPAARLNLKTDLIGTARDNLDRDTQHLCCPFDQIAPVALISPSLGDTWTQFLRLVQCWLHTIPILDVGGMHHYGHQIAFGIEDEFPFAPIDQLAAIKAALAAGLSGFDRLTINHDRRWFTLAPLLHAHGTAQAIVDFKHGAVVVPFIEIVADGSRGWEIERD